VGRTKRLQKTKKKRVEFKTSEGHHLKKTEGQKRTWGKIRKRRKSWDGRSHVRKKKEQFRHPGKGRDGCDFLRSKSKSKRKKRVSRGKKKSTCPQKLRGKSREEGGLLKGGRKNQIRDVLLSKNLGGREIPILLG